MTLHRFEELLKQANPRFRIRQRGHNYIGGIFHGADFICTISRGPIPLKNYRLVYKRDDKLKEKIIKRGRSEALRILRKRGLLSRNESIRIKWGLDA